VRNRSTVSPKALAALVLLLFATALGTATLSACGGSSTQAGSSSATPTATSSSATPRPLPVAVKEFRGTLPVLTVSMLVEQGPYESTKTVGDVVQMRNAVWTYRQESSDPRLTGTYNVMINVDQRQSDLSATLWGTSRLRNAGGTWAGPWTGAIAAGGNEHHMFWTMKGEGEYAGLVFHGNGWFVEAGEGFTPDIQIVFAGYLETTDGSPVPSAPGPGSTPANLTPVVVMATFDQVGYDTHVFTLDAEASDPRASGRLSGTLVERSVQRLDGSVDYGGSWTLTNEEGDWACPDVLGVRGGGTVEHFQYWVYTGSGAYEGLTLHYLSHFMERKTFVTGDTLVDTGWIEEAE